MERKRNKIYLLLSVLFIILCLILIYLNHYLIQEKILSNNQDIEIKDISEVDDEIKEEVTKEFKKDEYIATISIPKIKLEQGLANPNSYLNDVKYNLQIIEGSTMPDIENGNLIIAGHSGNGKVAYFKKLDKLVIGDKVSINYQNKTYNYEVVDIYDVIKNGKVKIIRDYNTTALTLITCRHNTNKQIVVICKMI